MLPRTRALIAAAAQAYISGRKVAGVHDHASGRDLAIAAEAQGRDLQGFDGDRGAPFGGTLPELYDGGDATFTSITIEGTTARGYDRGSSHHYSLTVTDSVVQLYDHGESAWFAFTIQFA